MSTTKYSPVAKRGHDGDNLAAARRILSHGCDCIGLVDWAETVVRKAAESAKIGAGTSTVTSGADALSSDGLPRGR